MSGEDESKAAAERLIQGATRGLLEVARGYPSADAWEALWLSDAATGYLDDEDSVELSTAKA